MSESQVRFPLSLTQQDIYFDQLHNSSSPLYNIGGYIRCGAIDLDKIRLAHQALVINHDAFGIRIVAEQDEVKQYISNTRSSDLPLHDFSFELQPEQAAIKWLDELFQKPIKFKNAQMCFGFVLKLADDQYWYVGLSHHLAMDGWGFANWAHQLADYYNDAADLSQNDSGLWQSTCEKDLSYLSSKRYQNDKTFWQSHSQNMPEKLLNQNYASSFAEQDIIPSARHRIPLSRANFQRFNAAASKMGVGVPQLFIGMLSCYFSLAYNQDAISFGIPAHNRRNSTEKDMVAVFTSVSPLVIQVDKTQPFATLAQQIAKLQKASFRHQRFPIGHMMQALNKSGMQDALFDISFNYLKLDYSDLAFDGVPAEVIYHHHHHDAVPLTVTIWDGDGEDLELQLDHNLGYFSKPEIQLLGERFEFLLAQLTKEHGADITIGDLDLIPNSEKVLLNQQFQPESLNFDRTLLVHELFEQQVVRTPQQVALIHNQQQLSYQQLNERANQLAQYLVNHGLQKEELVGVCIERSVDMAVAVLGILKAGGAYVALDPSYPADRLAYIADDAAMRFVVSQQAVAQQISFAEQIQIVALDDPYLKVQLRECDTANLSEQHALSADQLAYVLYTSGSTGKPKGVQIAHRNVVAFVKWAQAYFSEAELNKVLASTSLNFDLSVFELFAPLSCGGCCVIVENILSLTELDYQDAGITLINSVPSGIKAVLNESAIPSSVLTINSAGEPLPKALANALLAHSNAQRVVNLYGPTEDTVYATAHSICEPIVGDVLIGKPIANGQAYVLNEQGQQTPIGVTGELYLAGERQSLGYINRQDLTDSVFVANPFTTDTTSKLYKTGDLVCFQPDGSIAYKGRIGDQVKIRGFRIELGEIEHHLSQLPMVNSCLVVARADSQGDHKLIAYVQCYEISNEFNATDELRQALALKLPHYMIPSVFTMVEAWPLTPNGKIDKKALPAPDVTVFQNQYVAATSNTEKVLCALWAKLLDVEEQAISTTANFFALGGHSLLVMQLVAHIRNTLSCQLEFDQVFAARDLRALASLIDSSKTKDSSTNTQISGCSEDTLVMSSAQQSMWLIDRAQGNSVQYNMPQALTIRGHFNIEIATQAVVQIIARHQPLRTIYQDHCGAAVPQLRSADDFCIEYVDLSNEDTSAQQALVERLCTEFALRPFDLASDLMIRVKQLHLADEAQQNSGILLFNIHHIAFDGWSIKLFIQEFNALYTALSQGKASPLSPLTTTYSDYACWQQAQLSDVTAQTQLGYWAKKLAGLPQVHSIPLDRPRPARQSYNGTTHYSTLSAKTVAALRELCRGKSASLFMGLHAIFAALVARYSNEQDIVIGTPVANREQAEIADLMGMFVNSLVLRSDLSNEPNFLDLMTQSKEVLLEAYANQKVSFEQVVERLQPARNLSHSPLFQVMMVQTDEQNIAFELPSVTLAQAQMRTLIAKYDLTLSVKEQQSEVQLGWEYNSDLFNADTIERMARHFAYLAEALVYTPTQSVFKAPLLNKDEQHQQLVSWNPVQVQDSTACIHEVFEAQVRAFPHATAVVYEQQSISYATLNKQANQLAHYLIEQRQVRPDMRVGICLNRSLDMIVAILAVLKAGGAYVPLDPTSPSSRINFIQSDAQLSTVITQSRLAQQLQLADDVTVCLDDASIRQQVALQCNDNIVSSELGLQPNHLAYVIYTSGSTGQPKGVLIEHQNVPRLFRASEQHFEFKQSDVWTLFHSFAFDFSVWEIWGALFYGAKLVIVPQEITRSSAEFFQLIQEHKVTILSQTPSAFAQLSNIACAHEDAQSIARSTSLRYVVFGGEALNFAALSSWVALYGDATPQLINMYGITETTVHVTYQRVLQSDILNRKEASIIGRTLSDLSVQLMDAHQNLVPVGVIGEMYVGGAGVARGYLNLPELTQARFIDNPHFDGKHSERLYRSGDLARWLPDGSLEYMGRIDHQVKIRGFRIELGEIEHALASLTSVNEAIVIEHQVAGGEKQLVAYIASSHSDAHSQADKKAYITAIKQQLAQQLPEYMVPTVVMVLASLPLTDNGKVDRNALPTPDLFVQQGSYVAPSTETEQQLVSCWAQLLSLDENALSVMANFFEIGGSSLQSSRMIHLCNEKFGITLRIKDIFECPTIKALAARVDEANQHMSASNIQPMQHYAAPTQVPLSYTQSRIWLVEQLKGKTCEHNMPIVVKMQGHVDIEILQQAMTYMVARHDSLRTFVDMQDGQPYQMVSEQVAPVFSFADLSDMPQADKAAKARLLAYENDVQPFNLAMPSLLRAILIQLTQADYQLHINFHHIISDGWSISLFVNELLAAYDAFASQKQPHLPVLKFNYQDFALWQKAFLQSEQADSQAAFWKQYLQGCNEQITLPYQHKVASAKAQGKNVVRAKINNTLTASLNKLAARHQGSLFNVMHAALALLIGRVSGEQDFNIGIPVTGRNIAGTENILGAFLNNLPVRTQLDLAQPFSHMLSREVKNIASVLSNQDLPFEHILTLSEAKRTNDTTPLFQIFLNMLSLPEVESANEAFSVSLEKGSDVGSKFNITFYVVPTDSGMEIHCNFNNKLFAAADIERLVAQYTLLLEQLSENSDKACGQYKLVQKTDFVPHLTQSLSLPWQGPVHQCFEQVAEQMPNNIALRFNGTQWRYDELNSVVNYYAQQLVQAGVTSGDTVAIMTERSDALVIATLAVLKAGAAFMMLSKTVPARRILQQMQAVPPKALISLCVDDVIDDKVQAHITQIDCTRVHVIADKHIATKQLNAQEFVGPEVAADAPACIAFTSGTSGQPKAVMGRHSALSIFMPWMREAFSLSVDDRFGMMSGLVHDPLQRDMFTPLCMGATLCIPQEQDYDVARLNDWLLDNQISVLHLTPSLGNMLSGSVERPIESLRKGFFVGEALTTAHVRKFKEFAPNLSVVNLYGSTETSRAVSYFNVDAHLDYTNTDEIVPVGSGIGGVQLVLFNSQMTPCGVGEVGQIGVRSEHLSLGYGNDAQLNKEKFIQTPGSTKPGDVIYLTGDLGYYRADGNVTCLGRMDKQVKIRGFRVELAEIEAVLKRHESVHQVAITTQARADELMIVGCVVLANGHEQSSQTIRTWLAERLPDYMVPAHLAIVEQIPMTENGKLDSNKLSELILIAGPSEIEPPANELETELLAIWRELLGVEQISMLDDFFSIGGHSLLTTRLLAKVKQQFGVEIEYKAFFDDSSIRAIAAHIESVKLANSVLKSNKNKNKVIL
ncbi:amino acid adenylation domain-containing protein [Pseudoalteromonas sp. JBTF-M23]|uniref:Amino acid adenylation domain-containing protein n=1 Tax=Pseudoalteromonas caenipelagi TaxID=2726988 RepID=A0A849VHI8_9GAMM|nr:non-ribosomal peptide synthetase [Pseudoalteromonas caenipelagi]NOU51324.1 amino acid adenylation domain-containing protein [Pseudoalteromonas caenipelagi]